MTIYTLLTYPKWFLGSKNIVNDTKLDMAMISSFRVILGAYITPKSKLAQEINENDCKWSFTLF